MTAVGPLLLYFWIVYHYAVAPFADNGSSTIKETAADLEKLPAEEENGWFLNGIGNIWRASSLETQEDEQQKKAVKVKHRRKQNLFCSRKNGFTTLVLDFSRIITLDIRKETEIISYRKKLKPWGRNTMSGSIREGIVPP